MIQKALYLFDHFALGTALLNPYSMRSFRLLIRKSAMRHPLPKPR
jgi:hypothetical protein